MPLTTSPKRRFTSNSSALEFLEFPVKRKERIVTNIHIKMKVKDIIDQDSWFKYLNITEDLSLEDLDVEVENFISSDRIADFRSRAWLVIIDCDFGVNSDSERIRNVEVGLKSLAGDFFDTVAGISISCDVQISVLANGLVGLWDDLTIEQKSLVNATCRQMLPLRNSLVEDQQKIVQACLRSGSQEDSEKAVGFFNKMKNIFDHLLYEAWCDGGKRPL